MPDHRLLGISGALRHGSTNSMLIREAARAFGTADFTEADLHLPLYDGDLEQAEGIPPSVQQLADQIAAADAVVISGPEYNKALSGVLKNALDWVSRVAGNPWAGKPVAVMSAAAGRTGGEQSQATMRHALAAFRPRLILGPLVAVAGAAKEFGTDGRLLSERYQATLSDLMQALRAEVELLRR